MPLVLMHINNGFKWIANLLAWNGWVTVIPANESIPARRQYMLQAVVFLFWIWALFFVVLKIADHWGYWRSWPASVPFTALLLWLVFRSIPTWLREAKWENQLDRWLLGASIGAFLVALGLGITSLLRDDHLYDGLALGLIAVSLLLTGHRYERPGSHYGVIRRSFRSIFKLLTIGSLMVSCFSAFLALWLILLTYGSVEMSGSLRELKGSNNELFAETAQNILALLTVLFVFAVVVIPASLFVRGLLVPKYAGLPRRLRLQSGRIMAGLIRTFVLPLYLLSLTTFLRPLALEAPPLDGIPDWAIEEDPEYSGSKEAARLHGKIEQLWLHGLEVTEPAKLAEEHDQSIVTKLNEQALKISCQLVTHRWHREWIDGELELVLSMTDELASEMASVCHGERPTIRWSHSLPFMREGPGYSSYSGIVNWMKLEPIRKMDSGDVNGAIETLHKGILIANYASRGELIDWLVGMLLWRQIAGHVVRLAESGSLDADSAAQIDGLLTSGLEDAYPFQHALVREFLYSREYVQRYIRYLYRPDIPLRSLSGDAWGIESFQRDHFLDNDVLRQVANPFMWILFSPCLGNDLEGTLRVSRNVFLWQWVSDGEMEIEKAGRRFWRRGWAGAQVQTMPVLGKLAVQGKQAQMAVIAARTALALAEFRCERGQDADSLEVLRGRLGDVDASGALTNNSLAYLYLEPPEDSVDGANAYVLARWADSGDVEPGGGMVWLVVRNPAFGEVPFRICKWFSAGGEMGGLMTNEIALAQGPFAETYSEGRLPRLEIPVGLFRDDVNAWDAEWDAMKRVGWTWYPQDNM
jgi:hypothetical protein